MERRRGKTKVKEGKNESVKKTKQVGFFFLF